MSDDLREQMAAMNAITQDIASEALGEMDRAYPIQRPTSLNDPPARPQPAPAPQQTAQAAAPASQAQPATQPTQGGQPAPERKFAGKYLSVEELEKGAIHQQTLITNLQRELTQLRSVPSAAQLPPSVAPRANPVNLGAQRMEKLKAFEERHQIPAQELEEIVSAIAEDVVTQREAPKTARDQALAYMQTTHPRFFDFQNEVTAHVRANPALEAVVMREMSRGNYEGAMETAWSNFALSAGVDVHNRMNANNAALNQEVEQARQDAGLVSTQAQGVHQAQPDSRFIPVERLEQLADMSRAGYNMPLAREVFGANLPDDVFGINP